jgi:hypothetical protein
VVNIRETALGGDLSQAQAGVLKEILGSLDPEMQQELVRRTSKAIPKYR